MTLPSPPPIRKAVIPAAGLGTRLLPATKQQPKEMLPVFSADPEGGLCLKPVVQQIFEQLFECGMREFYLVVGREKRAIEDHFSPDSEFIRRLNNHRKNGHTADLERFYRRIEESTIAWVNQPSPEGFGDAVLRVEPFVGEEPFLVNAGDTYMASTLNDVPIRLSQAHAKGRAEATLTLKEIEDPRQYGVAEVTRSAEHEFDVKRVVEKPSQPTSKLAIMPFYIFNSTIFEALRNTERDRAGELQLTDAIQKLIDTGHRVNAIELDADYVRIDVGSPETYWEALRLSHSSSLRKMNSFLSQSRA
jgi:UTP--glucose-1-phosphate uridylyltransferase